MSGFWLGPNRIRRQRGDSEFCPHCQAIEDVAHVLFSCPNAKQVWESLLAWWGKRTHDHLDCSIRVTLLGLRYSPDDDQDRLGFAELATPFAFLRTHAYDILLRERRRRHCGLPARPVFTLVSAILKDMQHSANALLLAAREWDRWHPPLEDAHPRSVRAFKSEWISSGLAVLTPSPTLPVVLRIRHQ